MIVHVNQIKLSTNLEPSNAVSAIIIVDADQYLLQLRDAIPSIWFPSHWGLFGGAVESNESSEEALVRELHEELAITPDKYSYDYFTEFTFDFGYCGYDVVYRKIYEIFINSDEYNNMTLGEGAGMKTFTKPEILNSLKITPYDQFALWMHIDNS